MILYYWSGNITGMGFTTSNMDDDDSAKVGRLEASTSSNMYWMFLVPAGTLRGDKARSLTAVALRVWCSQCGITVLVVEDQPKGDVLDFMEVNHGHRDIVNEHEQIQLQKKRKTKKGARAMQLSILHLFPTRCKLVQKDS